MSSAVFDNYWLKLRASQLLEISNLCMCFDQLSPYIIPVGSVVEWLKRRARDQHGLSSKPTRANLLYPWEKHFTALSPAWWSWQAVLTYSQISIKLQGDSNILASPEAGRGNCLPYVLAPPSLSCESEG